MANGESNIRLILTPLLKLFIGVVVLLGIGTIVNALPMVKEIPATDLPLPVTEIVKIIMATLMLIAAQSTPDSPSPFRRYLAGRPLSYWVMTWFLFELVVLTAIGTFFRGPGWAWVWPWQGS